MEQIPIDEIDDFRAQLLQFMQEQALEAAQITLDELFPDSPGGCLCGAPCGCYDG